MTPESEQLLRDIFDILGFSKEERAATTLNFKKALAAKLLASVASQLSPAHQAYLAEHGPSLTDGTDPMVGEIRKALKNLRTDDEYRAMIAGEFRPLITDYLAFVGRGKSADTVYQLEERVRQTYPT